MVPAEERSGSYIGESGREKGKLRNENSELVKCTVIASD